MNFEEIKGRIIVSLAKWECLNTEWHHSYCGHGVPIHLFTGKLWKESVVWIFLSLLNHFRNKQVAKEVEVKLEWDSFYRLSWCTKVVHYLGLLMIGFTCCVSQLSVMASGRVRSGKCRFPGRAGSRTWADRVGSVLLQSSIREISVGTRASEDRPGFS